MGGGSDQRIQGSYPLLVKKPVGTPIASIAKQRISRFIESGQYDRINLLA